MTGLAMLASATMAVAQVAAPDPKIVSAAEAEGVVSVYSALDAALAQDLIGDFSKLYPKVKVDYVDQSTTELYSRAISEAAAGNGSADVLLSSAMDLQYKLATDGLVQQYEVPDAAALEPWAVSKGVAYGVTQEPLVIVYNKRLFPEGDLPKTRDDLVKLLNEKTSEYDGKVATIDPERIATGFLFFTQDASHTDKTWDLVRALGKVNVKLYTSTGAMLEKVTSGEHLIAYNIIGSYAVERAKKDPNIGVIFPSDYLISVSRIVLIPKTAPHSNSARLFVDYLLSERAQKILIGRSFGSVRTSLAGGSAVPEELQSKVVPVKVDDGLLTYLDQSTRMKFIRSWQQALRGK
ncbi:ABC transporter substrate-binding protein [Agrobacterium tumefaciens]|uniref:ABC transporter substrate-binding protein n=2 Tax=Agrobacterium tumefaciens TaxID=358 RepID=A0AA44J9S9_AGRTU|nr:ABC transporter substrate-binding protein [Agrobacterium tumefaciens]NTC19753.1 ABC transporter substrate-binding protein [Agrobacterium tumefaciens]NTC29681.1 ABC transporter substrate-binding protein [Agrobacterium tumefaciens]